MKLETVNFPLNEREELCSNSGNPPEDVTNFEGS